MYNIQEIFALPIGLVQVIKIEGVPLYGSTILNDKFIQAISSSERTKDIAPTIKKMVDSKMIIPCFADSGLLSYFRRRISKDTSGGLLTLLRLVFFAPTPIQHPLDYVLAFYHFELNKIIVLISNHIAQDQLFTSKVEDDAIALTLTHEMMHLYAHIQPNKCISNFNNELNLYYSTYFKTIFQLNDNKQVQKISEQYYKYLFFEIEMKGSSIISVPIPDMLRILNKFKKFSNLEGTKFNNILMDYVKFNRILFENDMSKIISILQKFKHLAKPLYTTYKVCFGKLPEKGCTQEAYYPSEVLCGYSDIKFNSKVKDALKTIV